MLRKRRLLFGSQWVHTKGHNWTHNDNDNDTQEVDIDIDTLRDVRLSSARGPLSQACEEGYDPAKKVFWQGLHQHTCG